MDKNSFLIEQHSHDLLILKYSENTHNNPICYINKNEIFFGKNAIKIGKINKIKLKKIENKKISFSIYINEDKKWNEYNKNKHPIRWMLGLIGKSKKEIIHVGVTDIKVGEAVLSGFFMKLGISVVS